MSLLRALAHLLLVLALVAGGLAPGRATAQSNAEAAAAEVPCHGMAADQELPAPTSCCDDSACTCDCLNSVPAGFLAALPLPRLLLRSADARASAAALPVTSAAPEIRPPIA